MLALVFHYLTKDLDQEARDSFIERIQNIEMEAEMKKFAKQKQEIEVAPGETETKNMVPVPKWKAPPGWTPPGWLDDQTAFQNSMGLMNAKNSGFKE